MIIPEILPDELGIGYLIRLGNVNGFFTKKAIVDFLRKMFVTSDLEKSTSSPNAILLSRALGISIEQYCRFHTLLPVLRSVSSYLPYVRHGDVGQPVLIKYHSHMLINREFKTCLLCMHEDIEYHGFAYYRREHQLPGFDFCSKHHLRLIRSNSKYQVSPDQISPIQVVNSSEEYTYDLGHKAILRYRTIIDSWASSETPIPSLHLTDLLQSKSRSLELRWSRIGKKRLFSDLVIDTFPKDWLESLHINVTKKNIGEYFPMLDNLLTPNNKSSRSCLYALALSVLFDNAEAALNESYNCIALTPRLITAKGSRVSGEFWRDKVLHKLYVESGGYATVIASKLGVDQKNVSENLNKRGLLAIGGINKKARLAFVDFQGGMGLMESCLKHGVELRILEQMLRTSSSVQAEAFRSIVANEYSL